MSGEKNGLEVDLRATTVDGVASGVPDGDVLVEFSNAVMGDDETRLERARETLRGAVGDRAFVEAAAVAANFNQMDRIADSTGIPSDPAVRETFAAVGREIGTVRYASAQNTLRLL